METKTPLDDNDKRRLILKLLARLRCAKCGQSYDPENFALVHRRPDVWVFSARCSRCDDLCHVVVFMRLDAAPEPVLDLTPEELQIADQWLPITTDDVLDVHEILSEFDGDFEALFAH
jgi:hypothetical protein